MNRYIIVQDIVTRLTDDPAFRTFFTLYLMADSEKEREMLDARFWKDVTTLNEEQQQLLRAEFTRTFQRLPALIDQLHDRVTIAAVV